MFGDAIFDLIDTEDTEKIEFGEFVQAVSTFCMFEPPEVLKFVFYIFDKDKNGYIGQDELGNFIEQLHQEKIQGNLEKALEELDYNQDGKFEFAEFKQMHQVRREGERPCSHHRPARRPCRCRARDPETP